MKYVKPGEVLEKFIKYLDEHSGDMVSKEEVIDELQDALDSVEYRELDGD